jgi:hypothetical protein
MATEGIVKKTEASRANRIPQSPHKKKARRGKCERKRFWVELKKRCPIGLYLLF